MKLLKIIHILSFLIFPAAAPSVTVNTQIGDITIYFTENVDDKLVYDDTTSLLINVSSSTIIGYSVINDNDTTIYFPTYDAPYYEVSTDSGTSIVTFEYMDDPAVSNFSLYVPQSSDLSTYLLVGILGFIFLIFIRSK